MEQLIEKIEKHITCTNGYNQIHADELRLWIALLKELQILMTCTEWNQNMGVTREDPVRHEFEFKGMGGTLTFVPNNPMTPIDWDNLDLADRIPLIKLLKIFGYEPV